MKAEYIKNWGAVSAIITPGMICALLPVLLGTIVIFGWYMHLPALVQVHSSFVPMQYNTALNFILCGGAALFLNFRQPRYALPAASLALVLAAGTLAEYISGVDLRLDQLFMDHYITVASPHPGRMSLNTTLCYIMSSTGLILLSLTGKKYLKTYIVSTVLGGFVLSMGFFSVLGYLTGLEVAYGWFGLSQMAIHTSVGFIILGTALLLLGRRFFFLSASRQPQTYWFASWGMPFVVGLLIFLEMSFLQIQARTYEDILKSDAERMSALIGEDMQRVATLLRRMSARWDVMGGMSRELWYHDAANYYKDFPGLVAIEWIDPEMIIRWLEPLKGNESVVGLSIGFEPNRLHMLTQSRLNRTSEFSPTVDLVQGGKAVLASHPVFVKDRFEGWVLAIVGVEKLFSAYGDLARRQGYELNLTGRDGTILFSMAANDDAIEAAELSTSISLAEMNWTIGLRTTPEFYRQHGSPMRAMVIGLISVLLLTLAWLSWQYFRGRNQEELYNTLYQRQSDALDTMVDGLIVISDQGLIQEVNNAAVKMFGYAREELIGKNLNQLMPEPYHSAHDKYIQDYHTTHKPTVIGKRNTFTAQRKNGEIFPIGLQVTEGNSAEGRFYTGVVQDLSEIKATEEKLERTDALLNASMKISSSGFTVFDKDKQIVEVNDALCRWLGYRREELLGMSLEKLLPAGEMKSADEDAEKVFTGEATSIHAEEEFLKRGGAKVWGMFSATAVKNLEGEVNFVVAHIIDIQQQKRLSMRLEELQSFQALITENNPDPVFVKDEKFRIVYANPAFLSLYPEETRDKVVGYTTLEEFVPKEVDLFLEQDRKAFEEGRSEIMETISFPNGEQRTLFTTKIRFENASGKSFILGVSRDVTERETLIKKLEKSNSDLDQFAYIASHDLKSPLNAIMKIVGWLEEDCEDVLPESSKEHLELLKSRTVRMAKLLSDLLSYSRINRYEYESEPVCLDQMVADIFGMLDHPEGFICTAPEVGIEIPKAPLEIVLRNLISNAIKHHDRDNGEIFVHYESLPQSHLISVQDDGPGIPPDLQHKAVEMFQTLKPRDQVEGSGMGLAIVKKIAEHYGGFLAIKSDGQSGTAIEVHWPRAAESNFSLEKENGRFNQGSYLAVGGR
ncbi:PAS domain S-box protein [Emcibacter sp.]|uniref:PAS domain S-box protein n=1 Tax=Emcibacter sp. TaxID=1979954 RepID=UPI002AA69C2B|nr:PAS domain S-box protein [Emcibacter sp.]